MSKPAPKAAYKTANAPGAKKGLESRKAAATVLARIINDGRGLDGLLDSRHGPAAYKKLSPADQSLVRAIITAAVRHRGEIEYALSKVMDRPPPKNARHLIHTLHVAASQILFLDIPDRAAVDLAITSIRQEKRSARFSRFSNAVLRRLSNEKDTIFDSLSDPEKSRLNVPGWLWRRWRKDFGKEKASMIADAHMRQASLDITVKADPDHWTETLGGKHLAGNSIRITSSDKVSDLPGFADGSWWVQDFAASLPAHLLGDVAGLCVADLCAAPGGKTAQLINTGANVTAVEQSKTRAERLRSNLERLNLSAEIEVCDLFDWQPKELFDAILLDAPCSSTGTIRRHPDVQWTKSEAQIKELATLQKSMVLKAREFLKPDGILLFSNCSIDKEEGENLTRQIAVEENGLGLIPFSADDIFGFDHLINGQGAIRTLPFHAPAPTTEENEAPVGMDGFFAAKFRRV